MAEATTQKPGSRAARSCTSRTHVSRALSRHSYRTRFTKDEVDVVASVCDLAVRVGSLPDSSLSARRLVSEVGNANASPTYLEQFGEPRDPSELSQHRALVFENQRRGKTYVWTLENGNVTLEFVVSPVLVVNTPSAAVPAVRAGTGLMLIPEFFVRPALTQGILRRVLAEWSGPTAEAASLSPLKSNDFLAMI